MTSADHPHAALLTRLFGGLNQHDPELMMLCYHSRATFEDIAFRLRNRDEIYDMWRMICLGESGIRVTFEIVQVDDHTGHVRAVDRYAFGPDKRPVVNTIDSHFRLHDGAIVDQRDICDAHAWAAAAIGGFSGFIAGRVPFVRRVKAGQMLKKFVHDHPRPLRTTT